MVKEINATYPLCKIELCEREEITRPNHKLAQQKKYENEKEQKNGGLSRHEDLQCRVAKPKFFVLWFVVP